MITYIKFKRLKRIIDNNIYDDIWKNHFLLDSIIDEEYYGFLINRFKVITYPELTFNQLHNIFLECYNKSRKYYKKIQNSQDIENAILSEKYFGFIENITGNSVVIKNVTKKLFEEFGDKYLSTIVELDKNLKYNSVEKIRLYDVSENIKIYLLIKYWQEKQHKYIETGYLNKLSEIFEQYNKNNGCYITGTNYDSKFTYIMNKIFEKPFMNLDYFTMLQVIEPHYDFSKIIGGKGNGLIQLNKINSPIPKTYIYSGKPFEISDIPKFTKYAIRSSATCEDSKNNSFAGIFTSFLDVSKNNLSKRINDVKNSIHSKRAKTYIKDKNSNNIEMKVIVQEFRKPTISGVWFGSKTNSKEAVIEYVHGTGEKLVSGTVTPNRIIFNEANQKQNTNKICRFPVYETLTNYQVKLGECCDFEWCIVDNQLVMLQYRPITTPTKELFVTQEKNEDENIYVGVAASPGKQTGKPMFLDSLTEIDKWKDNEVLLTWFTDPDWLDIILKSKAVVVAIGGFLSHTSIICREYGIPCVCALGSENLYKIKDSKEVEVDGSKGYVHVLKK